MKKRLLVLSFLGFFSGISNVWCSDEVIVDLSVLSEVASSAKKTVKQEEISSKNNVSISAIPVSAVSDKRAESSIVELSEIEPKFPMVKTKPLIKAETLKKVIVELKSVKQESTAKSIDVSSQEIKEIVAVAPKEKAKLVKLEDAVKEEELNLPLLVEEASAIESVKKEVLVAVEPQTILPELAEIVKVNTVVISEEPKQVELKLIKLADVQKVLPNLIYFAEDDTDLTGEQKKKISQIMTSFKNQKARLTIFSYSLNSDEDVHKRRLKSVTRAGEVRKYLISLGYKNSGMKIVNVDEDSGKVNTVEVVEVK